MIINIIQLRGTCQVRWHLIASGRAVYEPKSNNRCASRDIDKLKSAENDEKIELVRVLFQSFLIMINQGFALPIHSPKQPKG